MTARHAWIGLAVVIAVHSTLAALALDHPVDEFHIEDPLLTTIRSQKVQSSDCARWVNALVGDTRKIQPVQIAPTGKDSEQNWAAWMPMEPNEMDAVRDCDSFPCNVKLDAAEIQQMKQTPKDGRLAKFESLVLARMREYAQTGARKPYEFPGGIKDPWWLLGELPAKRGLKPDLVKPEFQGLGMRVLDFHQSKVRPIRQVLDRRTAVSSDRNQAAVWVRDIYTDHYFDGWGEWGSVQCDPAKKEVQVTLAMSFELDMLKKTDFFSGLAKGSMRDGVKKLSLEYLASWWDELQKK